MPYQIDNPWIITVIGGVIVAVITERIIKKRNKTQPADVTNYGWKKMQSGKNENSTLINNEAISGNVNINITNRDKGEVKSQNNLNMGDLKRLVNILFIDDDLNYKIVSILKKQGWLNSKIVADVIDLDKYSHVHIFFVDINGVGKKLELENQGMDLAYLLKQKYFDKKVIIYSSDTNRDMSHPVFKAVDGILDKNAQVYQFTNYIEQFAKEITF